MVLHSGLYAVPAFVGAGTVVLADSALGAAGWPMVAGAALCLVVRCAGLLLDLDLPRGPQDHRIEG